MINFSELLSGATNALNEFKAIQKKAQIHINKAEISMKDNPQFKEALAELNKGKQRVKDLEKQLKNAQNNQ